MDKFLEYVNYYEPARARAVAAAVFQILVVTGVVVGEWPGKVDAILASLGVIATLVAGHAIRQSVYAPANVIDFGEVDEGEPLP